MRQLLLDEAEAGGNRALGQKAWDGVRAVYTHDKLLAGGIDTLGKRLDDIVTLHPEFMREVYGDQPGSAVFTNLAKIADAYKTGATLTAQQIAEAKAARTAATTATAEAGRQTVQATRTQNAARLRAVQQQGTQRINAETRAAADANRTIKEKAAAFKESSLHKFAQRTVQGELADVGQAAFRSGSWYGFRSLARLLQSPNAGDVLEWAAYSNYNTNRLTRALTSPMAPEAVAALLREIIGVATGIGDMKPQASHEQATVATPAPTP
jgi:hypothetical protein